MILSGFLTRGFLSDAGSERQSTVGGWGWKNDPERWLHLSMLQCPHHKCQNLAPRKNITARRKTFKFCHSFDVKAVTTPEMFAVARHKSSHKPRPHYVKGFVAPKGRQCSTWNHTFWVQSSCRWWIRMRWFPESPAMLTNVLPGILFAPQALLLLHSCPPSGGSQHVQSRRGGLYIYIYIYMHAVKLFSGPSLAFWGVIIWSKVGSLSGPSLFSYYKNRGFRRFVLCSVIILCFFCPIIWQFSKNSLFQKKGAKIGFSVLCVLSLKFPFFRFAKTQ